MTQEEKARAYDKALKVIKVCNPDENGFITIDPQEIFPELKESEDKKIKNGLCEFLHCTTDEYLFETFGIHKEDAITWLKKQGQKTHQTPQWMIDFLNENRGKFASLMEDYDEQRDAEGKLLAIIAWLEKQGEQTSDPRYSILDKLIKADDIYQMSVNDAMVEEAKNKAIEALSKLGISKLLGIENQGEQKPTDKVEPKFHEGDYIKHNKANIICKVISIDSGSYYVENIETGGRIELFNAEQNFHLWTIEDAKDGDVLLFEGYYNSIVLFQGIGINGKGRINYHCKCDLGDYSFGIQGDVACLGTIEKDAEHYHPATKEQRDLLFQKIHDAGYEWDAEKKELMKMEQKPKWTEEDEYHLTFCLEAVEELSMQERQDFSKTIAWLKSIKPQPKQEWSEEDEVFLKDTIECVDFVYKNYSTCKEFYKSLSNNTIDILEWLKSLKKEWENEPKRNCKTFV